LPLKWLGESVSITLKLQNPDSKLTLNQRGNMTSKQRWSDIVLLIELWLNQRQTRHSFKTNGKSTWNQRVVSTLWKQTNFRFSFKLALNAASDVGSTLIRWAKSTLFQYRERRRFHVDSMSVCCLGNDVNWIYFKQNLAHHTTYTSKVHLVFAKNKQKT